MVFRATCVLTISMATACGTSGGVPSDGHLGDDDATTHDSAPPPDGPDPAASVFLAPNGVDTNPCTQTQPCLTFDRAYHVAGDGQVVEVAAGTYGPQQMTADTTKSGPHVVFRAAPGALAVIGDLSMDQVAHVTIRGASANAATSPGSLVPPSEGITFRTDPRLVNTGTSLSFADCTTDVRIDAVDMLRFYITGASNITIERGSVGGYDNTTGDSAITPPYQGRGTPPCTGYNPYGIVIHGVLFHDVQRTNAPTAHPDCLQFSGTTGTVVDGNAFVRCGTSDIMARPATNIWTGAQLTGLVVQNNFFTPSLEGGAVAVLGASTDTCGTVDVLNNSSTGGISAFDCGSYTSLRVVGNTLLSMQRFGCMTVLARPNVTFDHNQLEQAPGTTDVSSCGTGSSLIGDAMYVDRAAGDLHLRPGSPAAGKASATLFPPEDIDGQARSAPINAGADQ